MLRYVLFLSGLSLLAACTTSSSSASADKPKPILSSDTTQLNKIALSHVQAYLMIGNNPKAEERFQTISEPELMPEAMLALAELRAAQGDDLEAQQAFMLAMNDSTLNRQQVTPELLGYLCKQKKWEILQGYASGLVNSALPTLIKNQQLATLGLCFFHAQQWQEANNWLNQLDFTQPVEPAVYLALAQLNVEQQQYKTAQQLIDKYETNKTQIDAQTLWTSFIVYEALQNKHLAEQTAQQLKQLFPASDYTLITKTKMAFQKKDSEAVVTKSLPISSNQSTKPTIHLIKKGETLYQLSKRYVVSVADLLKWNPTLVVDDISLGTAIQVSE
ncbi:LysM peptidoglycan-binding domain-containing protein [Paraglaciecola hydrolytica]|uniref:LysM domain-containing protein n=1 Tax=Paraglaciecola hydrolytica TaxID=1799789 RepID=A0A136A601_9ALTE|nr:LysM peptidoglycan-binding domain-containing protein [Paraglaciecola hydrolytica]KXI30665.1 hypothetical protein AX660_04325 [Paraglaciecola hydrolytica]